ncbi:MAG: MdtA/MuxA family multidrug efflux RND transporter periplasmic adaptor subunit [Proteobacteria bacterium]|nr:MdtA/MuxA family multidrug efflux RND transporter periplasmic adaptor subunit [Pseudomonadota bacterium]
MLLALFVVAAGLYGVKHILSPSPGQQHAKDKGAGHATPVVAVAATTKDLEVYLSGLGNVVPLNAVTVRSRVDGELMAVKFKEGQMVAKDDLLAEIDPRPFQVQLAQAEGQLIRDQEILNNARVDLSRYKQLWGQDSIPKQQYDTQASLVNQYQGVVKLDQGLVDSAKLQLVYCRITAPISGRVGLRQIDPGNIIHVTDQAGLVLITQLQPISVGFTLPEDTLPQLQARLHENKQLPVDVYDRARQQKLAHGVLVTIDNQIDQATGTIKLKAIFANEKNELFPNQFVNANLLLETLPNTLVIPAAALQRGAQGTFVYLVNADQTVAVRPVSAGVTHEGNVAILNGLAAGDLVVVDGAERLREGSKIEVKEPAHERTGADANGQQAAANKHHPPESAQQAKQ